MSSKSMVGLPAQRSWRSSMATVTAVMLLATASCSGKVGEYLTPPSQRGLGPVSGGSGPATGVTSTGAVCQEQPAMAPSRVWQLTDDEYVSVVRQVFGVALAGPDAEVTSPKSDTGEYTNLSELSQVGTPAAKGYQTAAKKVAAQAAMNLPKLLPCASATPDAACIEQFIRTKVSRAYRRALADVEVQDLMGVYNTAGTDGPTVGVRLLLEAALQAPSFVYRSELGTLVGDNAAADPVPLKPYEIASALSFTFTESGPDDTLWAKAADGSLAQPAVLGAEVDRLMALPEAQATLTKKAGFWLGVERILGTTKDAMLFPEFTPDLKGALHESATLFVNDVLWKGSFADVLSSKRVYANDLIAKVYGMPGITGSAMIPVETTAGDRSSGILTQPAVLTAFSRPNRGDPIHRGLFIYNNLVCGVNVGSPPAGALALAAKMMGTERQLAGLRAANAVCKGCHGRFDPLGLTTERYDPVGRYHASDADGPVDSSSLIAGLGDDLNGEVTGVDDLAKRLGVGRRASDCGAMYLATYVLGRDFKTDQSCAVATVKDKLASTGSFREFFKALVTSPAFITRDPNLTVQ